MADDNDNSLGHAVGAAVAGISIPLIIGAGCCCWAAYACRGSLARGWRRLRVGTLGGVTTLDRKLSYNCALCQHSLDAHEQVRTLSCNHVFHCRESEKCENVIDKWLRTQRRMFCPLCRKTPHPVLPWKAPPASAEQTVPQSSPGLQETPPPQSSPDLEDPPLPRLAEPLLQPSQ